jgi:asparagine synthetase B (glutamine-hydrolysing)
MVILSRIRYKGTKQVESNVSTIAVLSEQPCDLESLVHKALDTMRVPQDTETRTILDERTAIGFVGSLVSTGKRLAINEAEGHRFAFVSTQELLRSTSFQAEHDKLESSDKISSILDTFSTEASGQCGAWSLLGILEARLIGGRDIIGQCPLFFGGNRGLFGISSCRKALWSLGISSVDPIPAGVIVEFGDALQNTRKIGEIIRPKSRPMGMNEAASELIMMITSSIDTLSQNTDRIGVLFSGGIDSSMVAAIANNLGLTTTLYTAAFEGSSDAATAEKAARLLGMELEADIIPLGESTDILRKVVWETESFDQVQVCVGMPLEVAAHRASLNGETLLTSGSGADELFGGYSKYAYTYRALGTERAEEIMYEDVVRLAGKDLLRDGAIAEANRVRLAAPFLNLNLVRFGLEIPLELKLQGDVRKKVLRRAAEMVGIPKEIVDMPKKAAQYSSKSLTVVEKLAKKENSSLQGYLERIFCEVFPNRSETFKAR